VLGIILLLFECVTNPKTYHIFDITFYERYILSDEINVFCEDSELSKESFSSMCSYDVNTFFVATSQSISLFEMPGAVLFNASLLFKIFSPKTCENLAQIRLVVFKKNAHFNSEK